MFRAYARTKTIRNATDDSWLKVPRAEYKLAVKHPLFRRRIREASVAEDEENSYYTGILNTLAEHCVGAVPLVMSNHPSPEISDQLDDRWYDWAISNSIGSALRQIRRGAARTGMGIGIPYRINDPSDPIGFRIKTVSSLRLVSPLDAYKEDRIYDGIQYDENWDIEKIFIKEDDNPNPVEYDVKDILIWYKETTEDMQVGLPECGPAFCLFPSIKRYMNAIVRGEEFRSCIPMAVQLSPEVYRPEDAADVPTDKFEYEPGFVPTLPPGTELTSVPVSNSSEDRTKFIYLVVAAAARCVQMPKTLALGDSSDSNMSTAAYDVQPWTNKVKIDRCDFEPVVRKVVKMWYDRAILASGYLPPAARANFTYQLNYNVTFEHPDPNKRANARAVDLKSGATTLHRVYTDQGQNPRRELDREARTLGVTRQELNEIIIASRASAPFLLQEQQDGDSE